ncbi:ABC transporter ATP-binding protein [Candidatus Omnitrophota bacterium]
MIISIEDLSKTYPKGIKALTNINLEVGSGMFGLLGPNGAGKTTLMRILVTLLEYNEGNVTIKDLDLRKNRAEIRALIGYLPQEFSSFSNLKTWEYLDYSARLADIGPSGFRKKRVAELLEKVGLSDARDRKANDLSGGMQRRLGIAQVLIGDPELLVVDEPTAGLDPEERLRFRNILADLSGEDKIIILSTHIVGDISSTCEDMAMLDEGEIVFRGSPGTLIDQTRGHAWLIKTGDSELDSIKENHPVIATVPSEKGWEVQIVGNKPDGFDAEPVEPTLEHAYVYFHESRKLMMDEG